VTDGGWLPASPRSFRCRRDPGGGKRSRVGLGPPAASALHHPRPSANRATTVDFDFAFDFDFGGGVESLFLTSSSEPLGVGDEVRNV
jgi:hypothetical protein